MAGSGEGRTAYHAVVVGAGPAGLSAAAEITRAGHRCLVVEQGRSHLLRDRDAPEEILSGVGGAGLFSDGKHSFHPSATELWRLPDRAALERAYRETSLLLARHGVEAPPFPSDVLATAFGAGDTTAADPVWSLKRYPSIYASLDDRRRCIAELFDACGEAPWLGARVVAAQRQGECIAVEIAQHGAARTRNVEARSMIVATGRLSPLWLRPVLEPLGVRFLFGRLEIGVRLEVSAASPLFAQLGGVDPKLSTTEPDGTRLLSFCTCRDGEVVVGRAGEVHAVSGRADGPKTGRSSIGILARITNVPLAREIERHLLTTRPPAWRASLGDVLGTSPFLAATFGAAGAGVVRRALQRFLERFGDLDVAGDPDATIAGPCIEGVGDYPESGPHLDVAPSVFVAGDACGRFRGIVASMVSGRYVGARLRLSEGATA